MEEKWMMKSCSEGKELILAQVMQSGFQSYFYVVDLKSDKIRKTPVAVLLNEIGFGCAVRSGSFIYNFGGEIEADYDNHLRGLELSDHHVHLGSSSLHLTKSHALSLLNDCHDDDGECDPSGLGSGSKLKSIRWTSAPLMNHRQVAPCCASLGGKVYALGGPEPERCIGEEFTPDVEGMGEWKPMPQPPTDLPLERSCVSSPVIPDEDNQRLLVHFHNVHALYAYYPATGTWDCLAHNFFTWLPATALLDGVLYSHIRTTGSHDCIIAYDVLSKSWLKVVYSANFPLRVCVSEFEDMFHLGKDMFCLAKAYPSSEKDKVVKFSLMFAKVGVKRTSPTEVLLTPVAVNIFPFKKYLRPISFIVL